MPYAILNAIVALAAVLLLILGAAWLARRFRPSRAVAGNRLRMAATLAIDARRRLHIVECDGRCVLLLTGPRDVVVGWLPERAG